QLRSQLLEQGAQACLAPGAMTFSTLARRILIDSKSRLRPITPVAERELVRRSIRAALQTGELKFYDEAAKRDSFVDLVSEHIRELRRRGIAPSNYARNRTTSTDRSEHQELALLYETYQQLLTAHALVDAEGLVWAACEALSRHDGAWPRALRLVVADGFSDFTAGQHELLRILAQRTKELLISLPIELPAGPTLTGRSIGQSNPDAMPRDDLFAKSAATLATLRRSFPKLSERLFASLPTSWPALDHVRQNVFQPPNRIRAASTGATNSLERLEFIEAAGAQDEIVQIAQRIKRLLTTPLPVREACSELGRAGQGEGLVRPGDILVIFRSLGEAAPRIRDVFQQFGIPCFLETGRPLASAPVIKTLSALLQLHEQDWPFRGTVAVITNNTLSAIDHSARRAADWLARDLQIAEGRAALVDRARQLAAIDTPPNELSERVQRRIDEARSALAALEKLCAALDELPAEATASQWATALARLGVQLGISPFIDSQSTSPTAQRQAGRLSDQPVDECAQLDGAAHIDHIAWQLIVEHLASLERLDVWLGEPPRALTRRELITVLSDLASHEALPQLHDETGRVRVLSAATARTLRAKHVFLAGMSEQAFPSPERAGRLATESDYRRFARSASELGGARKKQASLASRMLEPTRSQAEMLLFYEVLSSAEDSLTISYPALDERGQTLPPSPYVAEILRAFDGPTRKKLRVAKPQLSPVRLDGAPWSRTDWRIGAVAKALQKDPKLLAGLLGDEPSRSVGAAIDAGLRIVYARARRESFGPAEGILGSRAAAARFAERFGPQHLWSPSQWETYAGCPYKFFLQNVLGLEPLGELVLETDFARRGNRVHQVLSAFHRQWREACGQRSRTADEEAALFSDHLQRVIDERMVGATAGSIDAALLELDRRQIRKWADAHFDHHVKYHGDCSKMGGAMEPARFEFRFGSRRPVDADSDPGSIEDAFVLEIDGEKIRITGQIDRIDVGEIAGKKVFNVIDYKSGKKVSLKAEHIESGERLQLPIYVEAAQMLVFGGDATPLAAGYWSMASGFDTRGALTAKKGADQEEHWSNVKTTVRLAIQRFVAAIRGGNFPVHSRDAQCTSLCEFNTICRIAQIRSLGKTWPPEDAT
ncbi:MAG TPA: PD-(D/E)XK nuclease family protein, partial [Lacipirellulaceae bacterium]|nr:PD-(D/E)XK nuclease family protein [Lacipirellulaceae bacterium]